MGVLIGHPQKAKKKQKKKKHKRIGLLVVAKSPPRGQFGGG